MCLQHGPTYIWVRELKIVRLQGWAIRSCHGFSCSTPTLEHKHRCAQA